MIRDLLNRLTWLLPSVRRRYPFTPWPWKRCHCGDLATFRDFAGQNWCQPCRYDGHPTCECSQDGDANGCP